MKGYILSLISSFLVCYSLLFGQTVLVNDSFENSAPDWLTAGTTSPNNWITGICAGNGLTQSGTRAAYITTGGTVPGCGATGISNYSYANAAAGSQSVVFYREVNGLCATGMTLEFEAQIDGTPGADFLEMVYSTDNGITWNTIGMPIQAVGSWQSFSQALPAALDNTSFFAGFRFTYDDATVNGIPPAVDNVRFLSTTFTDAAPPLVTCPADTVLRLDQNCQALLGNYTGHAVISDVCTSASSLIISQSPAANTLLSGSAASQVVTLTVTDLNANFSQCTFTASVIDTIKPTATCVATIPVYANASCSAIVIDLPPSVTRADNCSSFSNLVVTQVPAIGSFITKDSLAVVTVTDAAGNQQTCNTLLVYTDTIRPHITCPAAQTANATSNCDYTVVNFGSLATVSDNCTASGSLAVSQSPIAGSLLSVGMHTITLSTQDAVGNTKSCIFSLNVGEVTAPVVVCPTSSTFPANNSCVAQVGNLVPLVTATDNCTATAQLTYTQNPVVGTAFADTIAVTVFATDLNGNTGSCQFQLIAEDTTRPTLTCLNGVFVATTSACNYTIPDLGASYTVTDNCSSLAELTFQQSPLPGTTATGISPVLITLTDLFGNATTCITNVHPVDPIVPTITCPGDQTIANGTNCTASLANYTAMAAVTDNCPSYTVLQSPAPGTQIPAGTSVITLNVIDAGSNQSTCTFKVNIIENVLPTIACPANISGCNPLVNYTTPLGSDNCLFTVVQTDNSGLTSGDNFPVGITTQTYTVIDSSGNTASCSFTIQVLDYPGAAVIQGDTIRLCTSSSTPVTAQVPTSGTGSWSAIQGTATFANPATASTTANNLSTGINLLVWTVSSTSCGTTKDTLTVIVYPLPSTANIQDSLVACHADGILIQTLPPTNGTGMWSGPAGITFDDPTAPIAAVSGLHFGYNPIVWTITSGTCPVSSDTTIVFLVPRAKINQPDSVICNNDLPLLLTGTVPVTGQTVTWNAYQGQADFSTKYASSTSLSSASIGTVNIVYYMSHTTCGQTSDTLSLSVLQCDDASATITTLFTPNFDGENDYFELPDMNVNYPNCEITIYNRWGGTVFESVGYAVPWDGNYKEEPVPMGTYFYRIKLNDPNETILKGPISIIR